MLLSEQQFDLVLKGLLAQLPPQDSRRTPRIGLRGTVRLFWVTEDPAGLPVQLRDLSRGGIGILHYAPLSSQKQVAVGLPRLGAQPLIVMSVVQHCSLVRRDEFRIGLEFQGEVEFERVQSMDVAPGSRVAEAGEGLSSEAPDTDWSG